MSTALTSVATKAPETQLEEARKAVSELSHEKQVLAVRLQMAAMWTDLMNDAHAAALYFDINYRDLPEFMDPKGYMEKAAKEPLLDGQESYCAYITDLKHAIQAAVRRKSMRVVK